MNKSSRLQPVGYAASAGAPLFPALGVFWPYKLTALVLVLVLAFRGASPPVVKLLIALVVAAIGAAALRILFRPLREHGVVLTAAPPQREAPAAFLRAKDEDLRRFRVARWFYYLGMLTITQTLFRKVGFTLSDGIFLAALGCTILERGSAARATVSMPRSLLLGGGLILGGGMLSSYSAQDPMMSYLEVVKYFYTIIVWLWLATVVLRDVGHVRIAVYCWIVSAAVSGVAALGEIFLGLSAAAGKAYLAGRAIGFTEHVNELGMVEAMAFLPAVIMLLDSRGWVKRGITAALALFIMIGLVLSVSLSAFTGLVIASTTWAIAFLRTEVLRKTRAVLSIFLGVAALGVLLTLQSGRHTPNVTDRLQNVAQHSGQSQTVSARIRTYVAAWNEISKNPFVGVGLDPASSEADEGRDVHNMVLLQWYEGGLLSFLGLILIFAAVWTMAWRTVRESVSYSEFRLSIGMLFSFIAFFVYAMSAPEAHHRDAWIFAALPLAMAALRRSRSSLAASVQLRDAAG